MGHVALVSGGTRGIGAAICAALKDAGHNVAANYGGNDEAAEKFKSETGIPVYKWDVGDAASCADGIAKVEADLGHGVPPRPLYSTRCDNYPSAVDEPARPTLHAPAP